MRGYWQVEGDLSPEAARLAGDSVTEAEAQGKTLIVIDGVTLRWVPPLDSLDAAWAEAVAALPEGWHIQVGTMRAVYSAHACPRELGADPIVNTEGPTPAAALRALAAKLRGSGR